jgi:hypothetical protein
MLSLFHAEKKDSGIRVPSSHGHDSPSLFLLRTGRPENDRTADNRPTNHDEQANDDQARNGTARDIGTQKIPNHDVFGNLQMTKPAIQRFIFFALSALIACNAAANPPGDSGFQVARTFTIANCSAYADTVMLVAYVAGVTGISRTYCLTDSTAIDRGDEFNNIYVIPFSKAAYDAYGHVPTVAECAALVAGKELRPFLISQFFETDEEAQIESEYLVFNITSVTADSFTMTLSRITFKFRDSTPDETYAW